MSRLTQAQIMGEYDRDGLDKDIYFCVVAPGIRFLGVTYSAQYVGAEGFRLVGANEAGDILVDDICADVPTLVHTVKQALQEAMYKHIIG